MAYTALYKSHKLIRLLHLSPTSSAYSEIQGRLSVALLDDQPEYEALSYAWGDSNDTLPIDIDCCVLKITKNLHSALKHLQLEDRERVIWADALCINQTDLSERMHQVSMMGSIYGQASQVIVWLGEGWAGSGIAIEFLRLLGEDEKLHLDRLKRPRVKLNGLYPNMPKVCEQVNKFFDAPWWTRVWTVQEYVLAKDVVFKCGTLSLSKQLLQSARRNLRSHSIGCCINLIDTDSSVWSAIGEVSQSFTKLFELDFIIRSREVKPYNVLDAIAAFPKRRVKDARDRVYGMLGLATGPYQNLLDPDYTLSPEEVCYSLAIKSVERTGNLEFLGHLSEDQNSDLPSFIPNWTGNSVGTYHHQNKLEALQFFNAFSKLTAQMKAISKKMISLRGVMFDTVTAIGPQIHDSYVTPESMQKLNTMLPTEQWANERYCHTNDTLQQAYLYTICAGMEMLSGEDSWYFQRMKGPLNSTKIQSLYRILGIGPRQPINASLSELELVRMGQDVKTLQTATHETRYFTTSKGCIGLGPAKCQEGDIVVVLAGGVVPYIIRPVPLSRQITMVSQGLGENVNEEELLSKPWYTILGTAYVHGIMDGEVFEILSETERQLKDIILV